MIQEGKIFGMKDNERQEIEKKFWTVAGKWDFYDDYHW